VRRAAFVRLRPSFDRSDDGFGGEAVVIFETESAVKLALLLRNLIIDNTAVMIEALPASHPIPPHVSTTWLGELARRPADNTKVRLTKTLATHC
jgi:hypothetical protein